MADEKNTSQNNADILSQLLSNAVASDYRQEHYLESIDKNLDILIKNIDRISMSNAVTTDYGQRSKSVFRDRLNQRTSVGVNRFKSEDDLFEYFRLQDFNGKKFKRDVESVFDDFLGGFEDALRDGALGSDFKDKVNNIFKTVADDMGIKVKDIPKELGKQFGKKAFDKIAATDIGKKYLKPFERIKKVVNDIPDIYDKGKTKWRIDNGKINASESPTFSPDISKVKDYVNQASDLKKFGEDLLNRSNSFTWDANAEDFGGQVGAKFTDTAESAVTTTTKPAANPFTSSVDTDLATKAATDATSKATTDAIADATADAVGDAVADAATKAVTDSAVSATADAAAGGAVSAAGAGALNVTEIAASGTGLAELGGLAAGTEGALAGIGAALPEIGAALAGIVPELLPIIAIIAVAGLAIKTLISSFEELSESTKKLYQSMKSAANRSNESRKKNQELAQKRLEADVETWVKRPFEILDAAATKWYQTWDNNLRVINGTQGYNKSELQSLMGAYADRLREEDLTQVVSAADISDNLAKVLQSGLSGKVAEEFAYLATKLNAAIPTQDFFSYADTYASVAANEIRMGKSQTEAIATANAELEKYASSLLYAGREIAGGFSTGLKNAESIFQQSVQIAQAAKTNNATEIAGVMTAVSAITGAIAPDLASSMTDAVYKAATGGNSSEIVALRSLAGINASNTEFLKQLSSNPKEVFVNLFTELSKRQNMSQDAFMEVAEGLSGIFGLSMDAFARVDFAYLAQAISAMDTNNTALADNMELLASGQTTTNDEMMKMQQINKYMLDEGLAYVIDNEAARFVQQHMWEEQQNRELMEATYAVELTGSALGFLEGIRSTIDNILGFLNPFKLLGKAANLIATAKESSDLSKDIAGMLEAGKVGNGNSLAKKQLTTRNQNLNLVGSINELLGASSKFKATESTRKITQGVTDFLANPVIFSVNDASALTYKISSGIAGLKDSKSTFSGKSSYQWETIGKSLANQIAAVMPQNVQSGTSMSAATASQLSNQSAANAEKSATEKAQEQANQKVQQALDSMTDFVKNDTEHELTYDDWKDFAVSKYLKSDNIFKKYENFDKSIESAGLTEEAVKGQFDMLQTQVAGKEKLEREKREERFWENNTKLLTTTTDWLESINTHTENLFKKFEDYYSEWTKYFIDHKVYNSAFTHEDYDKVKRQEKESSETAIYALADALTQNKVDLLLDPTLQTNALLAQILKVAAAILNQTKDSGTALSLPDTIAGLSLGIVNV